MPRVPQYPGPRYTDNPNQQPLSIHPSMLPSQVPFPRGHPRQARATPPAPPSTHHSAPMPKEIIPPCGFPIHSHRRRPTNPSTSIPIPKPNPMQSNQSTQSLTLRKCCTCTCTPLAFLPFPSDVTPPVRPRSQSCRDVLSSLGRPADFSVGARSEGHREPTGCKTKKSCSRPSVAVSLV
jgi:hypothetical protein